MNKKQTKRVVPVIATSMAIALSCGPVCDPENNTLDVSQPSVDYSGDLHDCGTPMPSQSDYNACAVMREFEDKVFGGYRKLIPDHDGFVLDIRSHGKFAPSVEITADCQGNVTSIDRHVGAGQCIEKSTKNLRDMCHDSHSRYDRKNAPHDMRRAIRQYKSCMKGRR